MAVQEASAELRAGGDGVVQHEKVQLFLALFLVDGGQEHPARFLPHHLSGRQVDDRGKRLADERLRLIELRDAGEDLTVRAAAVVEREAQKLVGLFHALAGLDLDGAEVGLGERLEVHIVLEQRLDLDVRKINRLVLDLDLDCARRAADDTGFLRFFRLGNVQRLHRRDFCFGSLICGNKLF